MDTDDQPDSPSQSAPPDPGAQESAPPADPEEAKRLAMRKRKPLGEVVKALTKEEIEAMLWDPEQAERDHLLDALPKGWDNDYHDQF
jgi:integrase